MEITVQYLGILADKAGKTKEPITDVGSLYEIREKLAVRYNGFNELSYVISLNGVIVHDNVGLKEGDQVALIPPVPGG